MQSLISTAQQGADSAHHAGGHLERTRSPPLSSTSTAAVAALIVSEPQAPPEPGSDEAPEPQVQLVRAECLTPAAAAPSAPHTPSASTGSDGACKADEQTAAGPSAPRAETDSSSEEADEGVEEWHAKIREHGPRGCVDPDMEAVLMEIIPCLPHKRGRRWQMTPNLQSRIDRLEADGDDYQAYPYLCERAFVILAAYGPEHEYMRRAVHECIENQYQCNCTPVALYQWLLPRAAVHWGPDWRTRTFVQRAAYELCEQRDPREHTEFNKLVTVLAQHLPGGLGWGSTVVAPVPDEEGYNRHAVMQAKADDLIQQMQYPKLAQDMLQRCVAYYAGLGQHWIGTARKVRCFSHLAVCAMQREGPQGAEPHFLTAKRTAQKELGMNHPLTLEMVWEHAHILCMCKRHEQSLSLLSNALKLRKEALGARHIKIVGNQVSMANVLREVGKLPEAEAMSQDAFETALKVAGPHYHATHNAYMHYCLTLSRQGKTKELRALKNRAERLGLDLDRYRYIKPELADKWYEVMKKGQGKAGRSTAKE